MSLITHSMDYTHPHICSYCPLSGRNSPEPWDRQKHRGAADDKGLFTVTLTVHGKAMSQVPEHGPLLYR